jgi:homoserine dehydrogenase
LGKRTCFKIAVLGLGTVGSGVVQTLQTRAADVLERFGWEIEIRHILVQNLQKDRGFPTADLPLTVHIQDITFDDAIDLVVEVMGGIEPAKSIIETMIRKGVHVVTANKELIAKHGKELFHLAKEFGVHIYYEASVAGGIPIIHTLQNYLQVNRVHSIRGIVNGTCNYILTQMAEFGKEYQEALEEAQKKGYAELDPQNDVEGFDAAYKLAILAELSFGVDIAVEDIPRAGITNIQSVDIRMAKELGCVIKLVAEAKREGDTIKLRVGPYLLPYHHSFARVDDVLNAICVETDVVGELTFIGKGAGQYPTASAVVEDILAIMKRLGQGQNEPSHSARSTLSQAPLANAFAYIRCNAISLDTIESIQQMLSRITNVHSWQILESRDGDTRYYSLGGVVPATNVTIQTIQQTLRNLSASLSEWIDSIVIPVEDSGAALLGIPSASDLGQVVNL